MNEREQLESEIRKLLATEIHPIRLSNKLFSPPEGLFCRIGQPLTQEGRREVASGDLFKTAQDRVHELMWAESDLRRSPATPSDSRPTERAEPLASVVT